MVSRNGPRMRVLILAALVLGFVFPWPVFAGPVDSGRTVLPFGGPGKKKKRKKRSRRKHYWGRRSSESLVKYKKRRKRMLKRCKTDELEMYSIKHLGFLVRTDISEKFTVDLALYLEELHRAYQKAFSKLGAPPSQLRDLVEVVCYKDQERYMKEGGTENSGGHFQPHAKASAQYWNRPANWPAGQFRLMMFTDGIEAFDKWGKMVMKHEAAHMELQLRLGYRALDAPRWWNEGMASCFEWWDFSKDADENFAAIPKTGRYAPFIRRIWGTDKWKDFEYMWTIDGAAWHRDMTSGQGYLNYCQAWSLAAFMFNQGAKGRKFFNQIFDLTRRMGADRAINRTGTRTRGWEVAFPPEDREKLEEAWLAWVKKALPKDKRNRGENLDVFKRGYDPEENELVALTEERAVELRRRYLKDADEKQAATQASKKKRKPKIAGSRKKKTDSGSKESG